MRMVEGRYMGVKGWLFLVDVGKWFGCLLGAVN